MLGERETGTGPARRAGLLPSRVQVLERVPKGQAQSSKQDPRLSRQEVVLGQGAGTGLPGGSFRRKTRTAVLPLVPPRRHPESPVSISLTLTQEGLRVRVRISPKIVIRQLRR